MKVSTFFRFVLLGLFSTTFSFSALTFADDFEALVDGGDAYTLVNLHPDEERQLLYTVNYQQAGLIPVCTKVKLTKFSRKALEFQIPERNNREYKYLFHKSLPEPFDQHLAQIFGSTCPSDKIAKMAEVDQQGIKAGRAMPGMTKDAVVIAIGPPPSHVTYSLDQDEWLYWQNRWGKMRVEFKEGKVSAVVD